jgi:hypothetical protein
MTPSNRTTTKAQKRAQRAKSGQKQAAQHNDGNLPAALCALQDAAHDLTGPRIDPAGPIPSRYTQLRQALYSARHHTNTRTVPSSVIPAWVDALKLLIAIDASAGHLQHQWPAPPNRETLYIAQYPEHPTISRIQQLAIQPWRPQDCPALTTIANQLANFAKAVDDLFAIKPIFLPDPCPRCGADHAYRLTDDGQRIRTRALAVTAETGATCLHCHDCWGPDELMFLGRILGYRQPEGVIA